jgi:uncharacterized protein YbbK (DUF523 family)/uncharacterized protein YbgA (DUF1722 family)
VIRIGVSACLLGRKVRYDGQHKRDDFVVDVLGPHVEYVPVCPEVELGLGTPRPPIHVEERGGRLHLVVVQDGRELTGDMEAYAERRVDGLAGLSGYILKKDSPSCGMERVRVHRARGVTRDGVGFFAAALVARWPELPVEEEGRLRDARLRESFVERVFAHDRLQALWARRWTLGELVAFHTRHKLALLAHAPAAYQALGRLVARGKTLAREELRRRYAAGFMAALAVPTTRGRHTNVLQHMAGYLELDAPSRAELGESIADYRKGLLPLVVPWTLLRHHARAQRVEYLLGQSYLDPNPRELMLRNHV